MPKLDLVPKTSWIEKGRAEPGPGPEISPLVRSGPGPGLSQGPEKKQKKNPTRKARKGPKSRSVEADPGPATNREKNPTETRRPGPHPETSPVERQKPSLQPKKSPSKKEKAEANPNLWKNPAEIGNPGLERDPATSPHDMTEKRRQNQRNQVRKRNTMPGPVTQDRLVLNLLFYTDAESTSKEEPAPLEDSKPEVSNTEEVEGEAA